MRLNLINKTSIVDTVRVRRNLTQIESRFGQVRQVSADKFKFALIKDPAVSILVERVDLGELLRDIPQDITKFTFDEPKDVDESVYELMAPANPFLAEPYLLPYEAEALAPGDERGALFAKWKRLVGLRDLSRSEVELGVLGDYLIVDASNAAVYRGEIQIKFK